MPAQMKQNRSTANTAAAQGSKGKPERVINDDLHAASQQQHPYKGRVQALQDIKHHQ